MPILLVEDNRLIAFSLKQELESCGYKVYVANGVKEAIKSASTCKPDLVLMDINLNEEVDGIECMKTIHDDIGFVHNIYLSGYARNDLMARARETSPIEILEKPVNLARLVNILGSVVNEENSDS